MATQPPPTGLRFSFRKTPPQDQVRQHLAHAGPIAELQVPMNADKNHIAGFAFVRYTTDDGAQT
eukprot:9310212-Pyramimonas_sp.AAC.1